MAARLRMRERLLGGAGALALAAAAAAQPDAGETVYRREALAHADAVTAAWRRLEDHVLRRSAAAVGWTGSVPPAQTGWLDVWTERGVRARYCDDTLLVYLAPARLKGVGGDHRSVRAAPHLYGGEAGRGRAPMLHWLEGGEARGSAGRAAVALPACLGAARFGGALPSGRAALAGRVEDPHLRTRERVAHERRTDPCPAGRHGAGRTMTREVRQAHDGRGTPVGAPVHGPWEVLVDGCRDDYAEWEHYTVECRWLAGPPHNREMTGREIWRRQKRVTAQGETFGAPELVSTSCWDGRTPAAPEPAITVETRTESASEPCPSGFTGTRKLTRTVTVRSTQFPWDAAPIVQEVPGQWIADESGCTPVPPPEPPDDPDDTPDDDGPDDDGPDGDGPDGDGPDSGGPDDGACDGPDDTGGPDDGTCGPPANDGNGGSGGGCFLTTAIVDKRGVEPDDGPTLTALRRFRDGYMARTAERRRLVETYYAIAPAIAAAIPGTHPEWAWIGARVDAAAAAIEAGDGDAAFAIYADMVRRLAGRWLGPAAERGRAA